MQILDLLPLRLGYPYLHDASANKNVHVSNASRTTHPETHLETQNTAQTPQYKTTTQGHAARAKQTTHTADTSLMDLAGRTVVDDMHSESSSAVDIDGGDADMRSSAAEQRQQEEQQQQGDATADATAGRETALSVRARV